jgi:tetratricopeptide (TPR) repeat protein
MKKPFYQQLIYILIWICTGIGFFNSLPFMSGNIPEWINIKTVSIFTGVCSAAYLVLQVLFKYRMVRWVTNDNREINIIKLSNKLEWTAVGILCMLWFTVYTKGPSVLTAHTPPVFDQPDKRFRILILPWEQECTYQGKTYNIGRIIQKRIDELGIKENIPLNTYYLNDTINFRNFTHEMADSLMKYHRADHILYGSYSLKECEGGTSDKICYNYQTNITGNYMAEVSGQTEYKMENFGGLEDIRRGNGKEGMDYIAYRIAGVAQIKQNNFTDAIRVFSKIKNYEKDADILFMMGICYFEKHSYLKSQVCNETALKLNPSNIEARDHLGVCYLMQGKLDDAKRCFDEMLKYCPYDNKALRNMARVYLAKNDSSTANSYLERIIYHTPPFIEKNLPVLGATFTDMGRHNDAKYFFEKALKVEPDDVNLWNQLAQSNLYLKDTSAANKCYNKALSVDSSDMKTHLNLAKLYECRKDYKNAQLHFQKTIQSDSSNVEAWSSLGISYLSTGNKEKAIECAEKALLINPENGIALFRGALVHRAFRDFDKAVQYMEKFVKAYPDQPIALNELGNTYKMNNNFQKALSCFVRALNLLPGNAGIYYNIAATYSCMHNKPDALQFLAKAVSSDTVVKKIADTDGSFRWLQGTKELCNIIQ